MTASCEGDAGALVGDVGMRLLRGKLPPVPFVGHHVVWYLFNLTRHSFTRQLSKVMLCVAPAFAFQLLDFLCQSPRRSNHWPGYVNGTSPPPPMRLSNELLTTGVNNKQGGITKGSQSSAGKCLLGRGKASLGAYILASTEWQRANIYGPTEKSYYSGINNTKGNQLPCGLI